MISRQLVAARSISHAMTHRILVVEDDKDILESMALLLEFEGFEVNLATNGKEALAYLHSQSELPHLVLLDLMMPVMDGVEFRANQRFHPRLASVPVIILSADGRARDRLPPDDAVVILRKPVDTERLLGKIRETLAIVAI